MLVYSKLKQDYVIYTFFLQATLSMCVKLASKIWCHLVSNLQRYDTISAPVPKSVWQFASEKLQYTGMAFIIKSVTREISECFFMVGALLKATNSSFQKGMTFCRSIHVKKVMKHIAFLFEQPSYMIIMLKLKPCKLVW